MRSAKHGFVLSAILIYFALAYMGALGFAKTAEAADPVPATSASKSQDSIRNLLCAPSDAGGGGDDLYRCINKMYRVALVIGSIGAVLMIVIAGYLYMSGGSEQISTAKSMMGTSVWGIVILVGSYVLLKAINPALVEFKQIAPTGIVDPCKTADTCKTGVEANAAWCKENPEFCSNGTPRDGSGGSGGERSGGSVTGDGTKPGAGQSAAGLAGCTGQAIGEATKMVAALYTRIQTICKEAKAAGFTPSIGFVTGGGHSTNSLHYGPDGTRKYGCAVDFSDNPKDPSGKKIMEIALRLGMVINPGADAHQNTHVHVSIGSQCGKT